MNTDTDSLLPHGFQRVEWSTAGRPLLLKRVVRAPPLEVSGHWLSMVQEQYLEFCWDRGWCAYVCGVWSKSMLDKATVFFPSAEAAFAHAELTGWGSNQWPER